MIQRISILLLLAILPIFVMGQSNTDIQLAREYLRQKEYNKAAMLYEELYRQQPSSGVFFRYYVQSLLGQGEYDKAERLAKKHIRKNRSDLAARIELGQIYQQQGQEDKAADVYEEIIDQVAGNSNQMRQIAITFIGRRQFGWAEQVYLAAAKQHGDYKFNYELANIYYYQRNYPKMIDSYLDLLAVNDRYLSTVKNRLNAAVYSDTDDTLVDMLKERLLLMSQKHNGTDVFNELLIWAYSEDKEYDMALVQAYALDKRNNENGDRIIRIVRQALGENRFGVVADGAEYIMRKGSDQPYYLLARQLYLKSKYEQVDKGLIFAEADIRKLIGEYQIAIDQNKRSPEVLPFYTDLARLYAFQLYLPDSALVFVDQARKQLHISAEDGAELDILEADIRLAGGDIFESILIYASVERSFRNSTIGSLAKLRKATMAFYQCDFEWALSQVDVLKASTSKFIANDAASLALLISENKTEDSLQMPLCTFAKAKLAIHQNRDDKAHLLLDSVINQFPGQAIVDDAMFAKANLFKSQARYSEAVDYYERVLEMYGYEPLAAEACFFAGQLCEEELNENERALIFYKKLLIDYPLSIYQSEGRKRLRALRDNYVN
jgi:tetratricopeptide (TPR) repeat protein